jgi:methionyl-tRNA formyltransferase
MNIAILTADEPLYLPSFFSDFLSKRSSDVRTIYMVPPRYGKDSGMKMANRYLKAFGFLNLVRLAWKTLITKLLDKLGYRQGGRYRSIESAARAHGVRCEMADDVNSIAFLEKLRLEGIDLIVSVSCPQVFKRPLIELPRLGCLNVHGALLPKYRGIAPSFWMMVNGEPNAGVTVFLVNDDIDAGEVVAVRGFPIEPHETLHEFILRSKRIACDVLLEAIALVERGNPPTKPLTKTDGSYFSFPTRDAYKQFRGRGRRLW